MDSACESAITASALTDERWPVAGEMGDDLGGSFFPLPTKSRETDVTEPLDWHGVEVRDRGCQEIELGL